MDDTWELINHPMSDETGQALADQIKRQNEILKGIAAGDCKGESDVKDERVVYVKKEQKREFVW